MQVYPAIDLRGGRCVRLLKGDFAAETRYATPAAELYEHYADAGAGWLHIVDLDGARDGAAAQHALIVALAARERLSVQAGGGVRSDADIERLLAGGVARVVVGSVAVREPVRVLEWLERYGAERLTLALDVRLTAEGEPRLVSHGWRQTSELGLWAALTPFASAGLRHVLCTDVDCDGALGGPNLALYEVARRRFPSLAWQASGGVRSVADLDALAACGVASAVVGRALLEGTLLLEEIRPYLPAA